MAIIDPPHPGRSIRENCLEPLSLSATEAARVLGVARHTLFSGSQRARGNLSGDGAPAGEGRLIECRVRAATPDYLRSRADTQGPERDPCSTIPGRSPRCEASGNRFPPANISGGAIYLSCTDWAPKKALHRSQFRAIEGHGCARL